ncbi:MAG: sulfatase [Deltaproteobacteria bacterium]|nr:sulfatase [Candidatus Zymogenaceae bacterium]
MKNDRTVTGPVADDRVEGRSVSRRSFLRLGAAGAMSAACAGTLFAGCASKDYTSEVMTEIDPSVYIDPEKDALAVGDVVFPVEGFAGPRPNIIYILTDDMGFGDLGCYGGHAIETPNIDRLADEGTRFTDFYVCSALCSPSRAGFLTGRYPHRTGVTFPFPAEGGSIVKELMRWVGQQFANLGALDLLAGYSITKGLPLSEITIAEALKLAGYATACIGKWHLGDFTTNEDYLPRKHGFDYFIGFNGANDDWPVAFWENETELVKDIGLSQKRYTRLFHEKAIEFIRQSKKDRPFFLYLSHKDPHQPCLPSDEFEGSSPAGPYGDTVRQVDWSVGEIMKYLRENGLDKNTLVIFTSDNGPWYNGSTGGLRGRKGQSYEGGYRVPMIARWAGTIPARSVCDQPAMNIDFFPTFLALAGLTNPVDRIIDGKDIRGLLTGREKQTPHDTLFFFHDNEVEAVRSGKWKYFRYVNHNSWPIPLDKPNTFVGSNGAARTYTYPVESGEMKTVRALGTWPNLYDIKNDPLESYDVAEQYPEVAEELHRVLVAFEKDFFRNPRGWLDR